MWNSKNSAEKKGANGLVAVAIDKDKYSRYALKWAIDHLLVKGRTVLLIHVLHRTPSHPAGKQSPFSEINNVVTSKHIDKQLREFFLTFRCFCTRKDIHCFDVILEDTDIVKALTEYVSYAAIENLVLGASSRNGFIRKFRTSDIPSSVSRYAPDFCTVYVISKGKLSSVRNASRVAPHTSPLHDQIEKERNKSNSNIEAKRTVSLRSGYFSFVFLLHYDGWSLSEKSLNLVTVAGRTPCKPHILLDDKESVRSPYAAKVLNRRSGTELTESDTDVSYTDISFVSSGRPSTEYMSPRYYDYMDSGLHRISTSSDQSSGSSRLGANMIDLNYQHDLSFISQDDSARTSCSSRSVDEMEAEMRRLKLELKQTMEMYSTACKEALTAKQKAMELQQWRTEEERKLEEADEVATALAETEKAKCQAAMEKAAAHQRVAELEARKLMSMEMKAHKDAEDMKMVLEALNQRNIRYRKYSIDEIEKATEYFSESLKIGEGGYGPVYMCQLDHTPVAVKVLRPDAAQGRSQFQQEVEVLSCIRHPNMVLLLGACPEYGCLVYEYMANGSLDDRLFRRGNTPALSWQQRFRIAAEIGTGLLFLHQTKPEPLVHRDLKPANVLLDHNFVSKIGDVGLARLVPSSVAGDVTQYRMTTAAGTFCYIDPEYQQTGMLGIKSDIYSLGILLLQLITAKPPMGLTHHVEKAIEIGTFAEMLDPEVSDWPVEEATGFAKLALQCAELRRKDRPDLGKVVLPELYRLRVLGEATMITGRGLSPSHSPAHSKASMSQEVISDPALVNSGYNSSTSKSHCSSSTSSVTDRQS